MSNFVKLQKLYGSDFLFRIQSFLCVSGNKNEKFGRNLTKTNSGQKCSEVLEHIFILNVAREKIRKKNPDESSLCVFVQKAIFLCVCVGSREQWSSPGGWEGIRWLNVIVKSSGRRVCLACGGGRGCAPCTADSLKARARQCRAVCDLNQFDTDAFY